MLILSIYANKVNNFTHITRFLLQKMTKSAIIGEKSVKDTAMKKITSFTIDHLTHPVGVHLSRGDGDIYTYDVRFCRPYRDELLTNSELHSLEHIFATMLRNGKYADKVIYVGPMGCQTGFYVLYRDVEKEQASEDIISTLRSVLSYEGEMPGNSEKECGYCYSLNMDSAKNAVRLFFERLEKKD